MMKKLSMFLFFAVMAVVFAEGGCSLPKTQEDQGQEIRTGVFYLVERASYQTQTLDGITNNKGEFQYRPGENVTFSIGGLVLGSAPGAKRQTSADLVPSVHGDVKKLKEPKATNMARFLQSLDEDGNVENGIIITAQTREVVTQYNRKIDFTKSETAFSEEPNIVALFTKLNKTLRSPAQARNYLRWTLLGVQSATNVKIPMRDGGYVVAKLFRPIDDGKYPSLVNIGEYGMATFRGCDCNQKDLLEHEATLDRFYEGNPDNARSESFEVPDASFWVPKGYVLIRIDARGVCNTPGVMNPYSVQQTEDFYDSIEWAAQQPWSNGNVGSYAASLYGINMFSVASLQPPHLKAMISIVGDSSRYREVLYAGGILNAASRRSWWEGSVKPNRCLDQKTYEDTVGDKQTLWLSHPFDEAPLFGTYDDKPSLEMDADMSKVVVPFQSVAPLEHGNHQHVKGSIESYIGAASKDKQLIVVSGDNLGSWMYSNDGMLDSLAFLDHWLKGVDNGVMNGPKVRLTIRTGDGGWYWQNENEYPIARTEYRKYYLDVIPSSWAGDGKRSDFMKLTTTAPAAKASKSYSADVKVGTVPCWAPGVSFVSEPLTADMVLAGWIKLHLWVSSTSSDSDIFASLRVMDKNNQKIPYALSAGEYYPVGKGWQKVSHRALDKNKSTIYRPWPTHTKADYAPLKSPDEVVPVDVEIHPTTALVRKGYRIRLDIQPVDGCDFGSPHSYDASYHQGASNTVYTGADYSSYVQLPVIPPK